MSSSLLLPVMLGAFFILFALGIPVVAALVLGCSIGILLTTDLPLLVVAQQMLVQIDSFVLLAIPLFIFASVLMNEGGVTERLYNLARTLVGNWVGGLAQVCVYVSILFGGMSGSANADAALETKAIMPIMIRTGYDPGFAGAVIVCSSLVAPIIPPSIIFIIYSSLTGASVGRLFIAGIIPGLLMGLAMSATVHIISLKRGYGKDFPKAKPKEILGALKGALWAMFMPVIILGGIRAGIMTPTEAAAIAAIYAMLIGMVIHRQLKVRTLPKLLVETARDTGVVLLIVSAAGPFGWIIAQAGIPQAIAGWVTSVTNSAAIFLLIINVLLLILGCVMEATCILLILTPVLAPVAFALGVDPVHLGIVMCINIMLGAVTPPFGQITFLCSAISRVRSERIFKESMPFILAIIAVLFFVTYVPQSFMWLAKGIGP